VGNKETNLPNITELVEGTKSSRMTTNDGNSLRNYIKKER